MTPDELRDLTHRLLETQQQIVQQQRWRPRKAAKTLCAELNYLQQRGDFWSELASTADKLSPHREKADALLLDVKSLFREEAAILARLGVDAADIGDTLSLVFDAVDLTRAREIDTTAQGIRNLQDRLSRTAELVCAASRGPLLQAADYLVSRKGATTVAAIGLGTANLWFAVTADGGAVSSASVKVAVAVATGKLEDIGAILGGG
jgi:hypothetical protein